jgi:hypothetical protein
MSPRRWSQRGLSGRDDPVDQRSRESRASRPTILGSRAAHGLDPAASWRSRPWRREAPGARRTSVVRTPLSASLPRHQGQSHSSSSAAQATPPIASCCRAFYNLHLTAFIRVLLRSGSAGGGSWLNAYGEFAKASAVLERPRGRRRSLFSQSLFFVNGSSKTPGLRDNRRAPDVIGGSGLPGNRHYLALPR